MVVYTSDKLELRASNESESESESKNSGNHFNRKDVLQARGTVMEMSRVDCTFPYIHHSEIRGGAVASTPNAVLVLGSADSCGRHRWP